MPAATFARVARLVCACGCLAWAATAHAQSPAVAPSHEELTREVSGASGAVFEAFNACDLETFRSFFVETPEFYHDKTGLETSRDRVVAAVKANICGKIRRELVPGSLEVHPIPQFGAIEIGTHRFYELARGEGASPVGVAKYVHVWQKTDDGWKLARVISYDHKAAP
jgi:ketosteroid isomerase-like protein